MSPTQEPDNVHSSQAHDKILWRLISRPVNKGSQKSVTQQLSPTIKLQLG